MCLHVWVSERERGGGGGGMHDQISKASGTQFQLTKPVPGWLYVLAYFQLFSLTLNNFFFHFFFLAESGITLNPSMFPKTAQKMANFDMPTLKQP